MGVDKIEYPRVQDDPNEYSFTDAEVAEIQTHIAKYPDRKSAVMPALWIAQEKWGWLPQKVMQLVADTVEVPYSLVYGVATFYTMYLKENKGRHLVEVCTCFSCGECGGRELYSQLKETLDVDASGVSSDKMFYLREAECLGACDTAPVMQVDNRRLVWNADQNNRAEDVLMKLRNDEEIPYTPIPMTPQREVGSGGN
jgi:NADH-quinone oxidoreductase subunit E